ncbi:MAG: hypothetical protein ACLR0U_30275 [Enterocloster clostridioformis]
MIDEANFINQYFKAKMFTIHSQEPDARRRASWYIFCGTQAVMGKTWQCVPRRKVYPVLGVFSYYQRQRTGGNGHV